METWASFYLNLLYLIIRLFCHGHLLYFIYPIVVYYISFSYTSLFAIWELEPATLPNCFYQIKAKFEVQPTVAKTKELFFLYHKKKIDAKTFFIVTKSAVTPPEFFCTNSNVVWYHRVCCHECWGSLYSAHDHSEMDFYHCLYVRMMELRVIIAVSMWRIVSCPKWKYYFTKFPSFYPPPPGVL